MIDSNLQKQLREKYNPDGSNLRKAQLRMAEMLGFIDKVCKDNGLRYWISFGTLLGAVRHGGFIPWDDDTDICMPVEDLKKFKKIMLEKNPRNEFVLQCHESDSNYFRSQWLVLRDLKSEYIQDDILHKKLKYRGLQVDIFPVERNLSYKFKRITDYYHAHLIMAPGFSNSLRFRILKPFRRINWFFLNCIVIPLCRLYKEKGNEHAYIVSYGVNIPYKYVGDEDDIFPLVRFSFEEVEVNAPRENLKYLENLYGDWSEIPEIKRTHNVNVVYL